MSLSSEETKQLMSFASICVQSQVSTSVCSKLFSKFILEKDNFSSQLLLLLNPLYQQEITKIYGNQKYETKDFDENCRERFWSYYRLDLCFPEDIQFTPQTVQNFDFTSQSYKNLLFELTDDYFQDEDLGMEHGTTDYPELSKRIRYEFLINLSKFDKLICLQHALNMVQQCEDSEMWENLSLQKLIGIEITKMFKLQECYLFLKHFVYQKSKEQTQLKEIGSSDYDSDNDSSQVSSNGDE